MRQPLLAAVSVSALIAGGLATLPAHADVSFHGFGQVVVGSSLGNDRTTWNSEYSADPSFRQESLMALQVQAPLTDKIMATAQILATGSGGQDFTPTFEWAYVSYWLGDHWLLKAGRQRLPLYRYSESLEVGESYTWIRPPLSVYQYNVNNFDGLSAAGDYEFGRWSVQPEIYYGTINNHFELAGYPYDYQAQRGYGGALVLGYEHWLQVRGTVSYGNGYFFSNTIESGLQDLLQYSVAGNPPVPVDNSAFVAAYGPQSNATYFYGASFDLHPGHWGLIGEFTGIHYPGPLVHRGRGYYLATTYTMGPWTPILSYGHLDQSTGDPAVLNLLVPGSQCPVGINPSTLQPIYQSCASVLTTQLLDSARVLVDYYEAGLRYDVAEHAALKLDWTRSLARQPPGYGPSNLSRAANVVSAGIVFDF